MSEFRIGIKNQIQGENSDSNLRPRLSVKFRVRLQGVGVLSDIQGPNKGQYSGSNLGL